MKLYLIQHGEALSKDTDPGRALSEAGRKDVQRVASFLAGKVRVARVLHSGKTRARQTAEILAAAVVPDLEAEQFGGLSPNDPVEPFVQHVEEWDEDLLVVGHLPFMEKLVARLATGAGERSIVAYRPGSIVCLETGEGSGWKVRWMIRPELLP
ncbi:MAG: phosphohistidine phosphatase SixA [Pseudomonadota bacterium]|nr:phosphohistidine phosphatase SixA [Pseudomonadota bacterium]